MKNGNWWIMKRLLSYLTSVLLFWYTMNLRQSTGNVIFEIYLSVVYHEPSIFIPAHITLYRLCKNNIKFKDVYKLCFKSEIGRKKDFTSFTQVIQHNFSEYFPFIGTRSLISSLATISQSLSHYTPYWSTVKGETYSGQISIWKMGYC